MTAPRPPTAAEPASATPPAAAASAASPPEPVPQVRTARTRRLEYLASEGGLLALSLMLALMIWFIVRGLVETTDKTLVTVHPISPPGVHATVVGQVEIHLRGPRGEVEDAIIALRERGNVVKLDVYPFAPGSATLERPFGRADAYLFPFRTALLDGTPAPPHGVVVRLEQGRTVRVLAPATPSPPDRVVQVTVEPDHLLLDAPAGALDDAIQPDPLELGPLLEQTGRAHRVPLTFERWRAAADEPGARPEVAARRAAVRLSPVFAVVHVEPAATQDLANDVGISVKPGWTVTEISAQSGFGGTLLVSDANQKLDRVTFTGRLRATQDALKALDERRDEWQWTLVVSDDDLPEAGKPAKEVQARLVFTAFDPRLKELEAQRAVQFVPFHVPVKVVSAKR